MHDTRDIPEPAPVTIADLPFTERAMFRVLTIKGLQLLVGVLLSFMQEMDSVELARSLSQRIPYPFLGLAG